MNSTQTGYETALARIAECKRNRYPHHLDLSNLGLDEWPEELFELENLTVLNLGSNWMYNEAADNWILYKDEIGLPRRGRSPHPLKNNLSTINPKINQLWRLKHLNLDGNEITSLETLPRLPFLKSLNLNDNNISQLDHLPSFPMLEHLELKKNQIISISGGFELPSIRYVDLGANQIKVLENLCLFSNASEI